MNKQEKQQEVSYLTDCFKKSQVALLAEYHGLTVGQITGLRKDLKSKGGFGRVVKNTLARISAKQALRDAPQEDVDKFVSLLDGPNFLVFSFEDAVSPAKVISDFKKDNEALKIKGGWVDGTFIDESGVNALSKMPSKEEVLSSLLRVISAPATQLVRLLAAPSTQVVRVIDAQREKLEKAG